MIPRLSHILHIPTGCPGRHLVAAVGMGMTNQPDFASGRFPFIFLAALAAPAAGWMGNRFGRNRLSAWLAAGMAVFSGYYAVYAATVDSFFLVMLGAWAILVCLDKLISRPERYFKWLWFFSGLAVGWMHLNRADGLLWLGLVLVVWIILTSQSEKTRSHSAHWVDLLLVLSGYIAITGFWYYRNLMELGSLFPPNSSRALWVTTYDELFSFPPQTLTFEHWIASGLSAIVTDRLGALGSNLISMFGVQGQVFLFPLWIVALRKLRQDRLVQIGFSMEVAILLVMSFVFPYSGKQGGFLHSSAALQPFFWGLAAAGFADVVFWAAGKRKWEPQRAVKLFAPALVLVCGLATFFVFQILVIGNDPANPVWDENYRGSISAKELVDQNDIPATARVMINNPAGFNLVSGREALVVPYGDPTATLAVAKKFDVEYVLLEKNLVIGLHNLYLHPEEYSEFTLIDKHDDQLLLRINSVNGGNQ